MSDPKAQYKTNAMSGTGTNFMAHHSMWFKVRQQFKSALLGMILGVIIPTLAFGQASLLPNAKQQYLDDSGNPVASGHVDYYVPSTLTRKTVWQDAAETTPQTNPVLLDAAGRPQPAGQTFGSGSYRQRVVDQNGVTIWDAVTSSTGSSSGGGTSSSEGVMVGTIIPWVNITLPSQYLYTAGQAISRSTYSQLFTAITYSVTILCQSGIATITVSTTISDSVPIGAPVEFSCFAPGTVVSSKTSGTLTLSTNATATISTTGTILPWGNGNGSTTFNVPDLRGRVLAGRDNMTGSIAGRLSIPYYSTTNNPDSINAAGGAQSELITAYQVPTITSINNAQNINVSYGGNVALTSGTVNTVLLNGGASSQFPQTSTTWTGSTSSVTVNGISVVTTGNSSGLAATATVGSGGSGYSAGTQTLTVLGGTCLIQPKFTVTVAAGAITIPVLSDPGYCTVVPVNPVATSGGGGTGGTLNVSYSQTPLSTVQPTITSDFIIKALPDDSPTGPGVSSIGGMTGVISCGANITCTANSISAAATTITINVTPLSGAAGNALLYNNAATIGATAAGVNGQIVVGVTSGAPTFAAVSADATIANTGALTLATVNSNVGTFGSATVCTVLTVNGKGLITAVTTATCTPGIASITGLGTGVSTALATNVGLAGAPILFNGAAGTPTSLVLTNATSLPATSLTGTLTAGVQAAHTGDVTSSAGSLALAYANVVPVTKGGAGAVNGTLRADGAGNVSQSAMSGISDYAATTWTPTLVGQTSGSFTLTTAVGSYERIGRFIRASFTVISSANGAVGNVLLGGLPFASSATASDDGICVISFQSGLTNTGGYTTFTGVILQSVSVAQLYENGSGVAAQQAATGRFAAATTMIGTCFYHN